VGPSGSAEKRRSVHVEEIEDEDVPHRNIQVLKTTDHSCLKSTKVEAPKSTQRATALEVVDDEDTLLERKGLSRTLPVLMDPTNSLTIDDIEEIVDRVSTVPVILEEDAAATLEDLHEIDELVQEFMRVQYPRESYHESTARRSNPMPSEPTPAKKLDINEALHAVTEAHAKDVKKMGTFTEDNITELRAKWLQSCQDIMNGVPEELPPMRGVNHHIPLIDENKQYHYHLPWCPDSMKVQLMEKIMRYTWAGWWESVQTGGNC
jgi:hypothetical protein